MTISSSFDKLPRPLRQDPTSTYVATTSSPQHSHMHIGESTGDIKEGYIVDQNTLEGLVEASSVDGFMHRLFNDSDNASISTLDRSISSSTSFFTSPYPSHEEKTCGATNFELHLSQKPYFHDEVWYAWGEQSCWTDWEIMLPGSWDGCGSSIYKQDPLPTARLTTLSCGANEEVNSLNFEQDAEFLLLDSSLQTGKGHTDQLETWEAVHMVAS